MPTTASSSCEPPARRWEKPRAYAAREGIDWSTLRAWMDKGVLEVRRMAPRTGVRVRAKDDDA